MTQPFDARLILEDGSSYSGFSVGATGTALGELVFNTSVTGYQEILTDPSYKGQMVLMTHPEIGNYGTHSDDNESDRVHAAGFIVRRMSPSPSSWRSEQPLPEFMRERGIVGIAGVDTRELTRKIRSAGAMKTMITTEALTTDAIRTQLQQLPGLSQQADLVEQVSTPKAYTLTGQPSAGKTLDHLVILDYGVKRSILNQFQALAKRLPCYLPKPPLKSFRHLIRRRLSSPTGPGILRCWTGRLHCPKP